MKTNITNLIGNTPMVKLEYFSTDSCNIYAKLEGQNIGGSVKDRVALALIEDLEKNPAFSGQTTIYEPSSGNTGIGLAMIGTYKKYKVRILLPENATAERITLLKFYGAEVEFCSKEDWKGEKAIIKCKQSADNDEKMMMPNQYENPVCIDIHYRTTGAEILTQCPDITHFVSTMGTGGTITGVAKKLKEHDPQTLVTGVEIGPDSAISGPRNLVYYVPPILDFNFIDNRVMIEDEKRTFELHRKLAEEEGLFVGLSSAAALQAALELAGSLSAGQKANIVCIFPDKGDRYLSKFDKT